MMALNMLRRWLNGEDITSEHGWIDVVESLIIIPFSYLRWERHREPDKAAMPLSGNIICFFVQPIVLNTK